MLRNLLTDFSSKASGDNNMNFNEVISKIRTKDDFIKFLNLLREDLAVNRHTWENASLHSYLEAMEGWLEDMEGYYSNTNQPIPIEPSWKTFADILYASKIYE